MERSLLAELTRAIRSRSRRSLLGLGNTNQPKGIYTTPGLVRRRSLLHCQRMPS